MVRPIHVSMASRSSRHRATSQTPSHEDEFGCVPAVLQRTDSSRRHVPARGGNGIGGPCQQPRAVSPKGRCSHRWLRHNAERGAFPIATSIAVGTPVSRGPRADPDVHSHASGSCLRSNGKPRSLPYPLDRLGHAFPPLCAARALDQRIPFGSGPSLQRLRTSRKTLVRRLHS